MSNITDSQSWNVNGRSFTFFHVDYSVGCGGDEIPLPWGGKHYLYVWNKVEKVHEYFCFEDDLFMGDTLAPWLDVNKWESEKVGRGQ